MLAAPQLRPAPDLARRAARMAEKLRRRDGRRPPPPAASQDLPRPRVDAAAPARPVAGLAGADRRAASIAALAAGAHRDPGRPAHRHRVRAPPTASRPARPRSATRRSWSARSQTVSLRDDRKRVIVDGPARPLGGRPRGRGHPVLGRPAAHRRRRRQRPRHAAVGRLHRHRRRRLERVAQRASSASRRRRSCCAASPGAIFVLRADDLGSLDVGSPVLLPPHAGRPRRRLHARPGARRAVGAGLRRGAVPDAGDAAGALLERERHRPAAQRQRPDAQHADARVGARRRPRVRAAARRRRRRRRRRTDSRFMLFNDRRAALAPPTAPPMPVRMVFDQSVRGLAEARRSTCSASRSAASAASRSQYDAQAQALPGRGAWPTSIRCASARCATRCSARTPAAGGRRRRPEAAGRQRPARAAAHRQPADRPALRRARLRRRRPPRTAAIGRRRRARRCRRRRAR